MAMKFLKIAIGALLAMLALAPLPAISAGAYYQPTGSIALLEGWGAASPSIAHADVNGYGKYDWWSLTSQAPYNQACPAVSATNYIVAANTVPLATGCWVHQGTEFVATIADMEALPPSIAGKTVIVGGSQGGTFIGVSGTCTTDGGTIFCDSNDTSGYWQRQFNGAVYVTWFGADPTDTAPASAIINGVTAAFKDVYVPDGTYNANATIVVQNGHSLTGPGSAVLHRHSGGATTPVLECLYISTVCKGVTVSDSQVAPKGVVVGGDASPSDAANAWWWSISDMTILGTAGSLTITNAVYSAPNVTFTLSSNPTGLVAAGDDISIAGTSVSSGSVYDGLYRVSSITTGTVVATPETGASAPGTYSSGGVLHFGIALYVPSGQIISPSLANYYSNISNINIDGGGIGIELGDFANAHNFVNVHVWMADGCGVNLKGAYANNISNIFVNDGNSDYLTAYCFTAPTSGTFYTTKNNILSAGAETAGAHDKLFFVDANSFGNSYVGISNEPALGSINNLSNFFEVNGNIYTSNSVVSVTLQASGPTYFGYTPLTANDQNDVCMFAASGGCTAAQSGSYLNKVKIFGGYGQSRDLELQQTSGASVVSATGGDIQIDSSASNGNVILNTGTGLVTIPSIHTSAPSTHCALWSNAGVLTVTTCP
jgi:hypothetical protein